MSSLRPQAFTDEQLDPDKEPGPNSIAETPRWHGETTSYVPGLNSLSDLFLIWHEAQSLNNDGQSPEDLIRLYLEKIQHVIDCLPPELRWRGGLSRPHNITYGHDVQIANIFVASLHIRSNILQKYGPTATTAAEHQWIVDDLLEILYRLPPTVFDANGSSLVPKIRDIGAAYLEQVVATDRVDSSVGNAREKLERVLRKLEDLDCWAGLKAIHSPGTVV
jgi:hypothetical protein